VDELARYRAVIVTAQFLSCETAIADTFDPGPTISNLIGCAAALVAASATVTNASAHPHRINARPLPFDNRVTISVLPV
jgi:hypothetical protein